MANANVEERLTILETEFRTELRHLVTKEDLKALEMRMYAAIVTTNVAILSAMIAVVRLWQ